MNRYSGNRDQSRSNSKKVIECYHCGKKGHKKRDCWSLKKENEELKRIIGIITLELERGKKNRNR